MKEKQEYLLKLLLQQDTPISSRILAEKMNVSMRTVKNYIYELNKLGAVPVIASSNAGYTVIREEAEKLLEEPKNDTALPQTFKERSFFIIKRILMENQQLNIFDLSEELFVSYSTLKSDLSRMNKAYEKYHVKFILKQDEIQIIGEEKEKRRLISYIIFEEVPHKFIDKQILEATFDKQDIEKLAAIIHSIMQESNYHLNDFSFVNLMLHLLILLESVRNDNSLVSRNWFSSWLREDKAKLVTKMIEQIEQEFDLTLNSLEKEEIHMIFQANANYIPSNNLKELEQIVGEEISQAVDIVLEDVRQTFGINLMSENFIVPFSLHVSGLFSRAKQQTSLKNPMVSSLKKDFPMVYDVAVYISLRLSNRFSISVSEDETAYIALHIGSELEGQKRNLSKIRTVLLCPKYMNLDEQLYEKLNHHFGNDLIIQTVVSKFSETEDLDFELLITTLPVPENPDSLVIEVSPIFTEEQRMTLITEIGNIRLDRKKSILRKNFDDYFDEKFFTSQLAADCSEAVINELCQVLEAENIVPAEFKEHVLERERASSTAFEAIAIPHSVYMDAHQTVISVAISEKGLLWGDKKVHVVLLAAINDIDRRLFTDIYEALISLFDTAQSYQEIKKIQNFADFRSFIYSKIKRNY
ncbi:PRD domain-containing protein [Enterococcus hulanensis]|uniref:BglG family transcription antiterminator n=1 Tax=Enterococcus hulanensis TaxID=2559929 RepID=UPI00288E62A4|nr:PRD domain-containing protein [Enterococcus hulanensis]MDT2660585.1 PRD domain-containing protein [Enterococcus hulanensis]